MKRQREEETKRVYISCKHHTRLHREWLILQLIPECDRAMVRKCILALLYDVKCDMGLRLTSDTSLHYGTTTFNTCFTPIKQLSGILLSQLGTAGEIRFKTIDKEEVTIHYSYGILKIQKKEYGEFLIVTHCHDFYGACDQTKKDTMTLYDASNSRIWQTIRTPIDQIPKKQRK